MREGSHNDHMALAYAVCEVLENRTGPLGSGSEADHIKNKEAVIVDADGMRACAFRLSEGGECSITHTYEAEGAAGEDFYSRAAGRCLSDSERADELFRFCGKGKRILARYLRSEKTEDEQFFETADGISVSCKQVTDVYDEGYLDNIREVAERITEKTGTEVPVILAGKLFAFYPCEHTVREVLSPMPFVPLPNLLTEESLFADTKDLILRGEEIAAERERKKKTVQKNIMLRVKKLCDEGLADSITILAAKGDDTAKFQNRVYSDEVLICKGESMTLVADSETFAVPVPDAVFEDGKETVGARFGLVLENEELRFFVETEKGTTTLDTDPRIFEKE